MSQTLARWSNSKYFINDIFPLAIGDESTLFIPVLLMILFHVKQQIVRTRPTSLPFNPMLCDLILFCSKKANNVSHETSLADTKIFKNNIKDIFNINTTGNSPQRPHRQP